MPWLTKGGLLRDDSGALVVAGAQSFPLDIGEEVIPRLAENTNAAAIVTGDVRLMYFTARRSETITQMRMITGGTAATATPTAVKFGVYSEDPVTGDLTRVALTASDTSIFATINTMYARALLAPFNKVAGQRYAAALFLTTAVATPTLTGISFGSSTTALLTPRVAAKLAGQADLPVSIPAGTLVASGFGPQAHFLP